MKTSARPHLPAIALEILGYLLRNPAAEDTIEGIAEWWLLDQRTMQTTHKVREALAKLHQHEFVVMRPDAEGRTHYYLNSARRDEAAELWKRRGQPHKGDR